MSPTTVTAIEEIGVCALPSCILVVFGHGKPEPFVSGVDVWFAVACRPDWQSGLRAHIACKLRLRPRWRFDVHHSPLVGSVFGPKQENSKLLSLSHRHCKSPNLLKISIKWAEGPQDDRELARSMRKITRNLQIISMFVPIWRVIPQIRREHPQNLKN